MNKFERYERVFSIAFWGLVAVCVCVAAVRGWVIVIDMVCRCDCK